MIFGYARVSSKDQNLDLQMKELKAYGCDRIYQEKQSGKDKVIYDRIVQLLESGMSVMDIHREVGVVRNMIYGIKRELYFVSNYE